MYSALKGYLGCFHVLAIVNSVAMSIGLHVAFWTRFSLNICPAEGLLDHMVALFLVLRRWILESNWFWVPGLPFPSCIILGKSLDVSEPLPHRVFLRNLAFSPSINSSFLLVLVIRGPLPSDLSIFSQSYIHFPLSHLLGLVAWSYVSSQPGLTCADP